MMKTKPGASNPMQKGKRRQKLHEDQNNVGDPKKKTEINNYKENKME